MNHLLLLNSFRFPIRSLTAWIALLSGLVLILPGAAQPSSIGLNQPVAVIVTRYQGTETSPFTSADWAATMNDRVNAFYAAATGGQTTFLFVPIPGVVTLPYAYEDTAPPDVAGFDLGDDPLVLFREVHDAIGIVLDQNNNALNGIGRVVVILNRYKRARAMSEFPFLYNSTTHPVVTVSSCIVIDPYSRERPEQGRFNLSPGETDTDGDGLADVDEVIFGSDPENPDSDGDGLSDRSEFNLGSDPNNANTDGDGFSDWEEVILRSDALNAAETPPIPDNEISVAVHEIGHQLGLGDLYRLDFGGTAEPYESWGVMAWDNLQNFSAFSRQDAGWTTSANGMMDLDIGENGLIPITFVMHPPSAAAANGAEILRIRRPNFADLLVEARTPVNADAPRPYVLGNSLSNAGLPRRYENGLVISQTDQRYAVEGDLLRFVTGAPVSKILPQFGPNDCSPETGIDSAIRGLIQGPALVRWDHSLNPDYEAFLEIALDGALVELVEETVTGEGSMTALPLDPPLVIPDGLHEVTIRHRTSPGDAGGDLFLSDIEILHAPVITHDPQDVDLFAGQNRLLYVVVSLASQVGAQYQWEREVNGTWTPVPGATSQSLPLSNVLPSQAGRYRARVSNDAGAAVSQPAELRIFQRAEDPVASALNQPGREFTQSSVIHQWIPNSTGNGVQPGAGLSPGLPIALTTPVEGPGAVQFDWLRSNDNPVFQFFVDDVLIGTHLVAGLSSVSMNLQEGSHVLRWTFSQGDEPGGALLSNLQITPAPSIIRSPENRVVHAGEDATLHVSLNVSDASGFFFDWYRDGVLVVADGSDSLTLTNLEPADSGEYHVEIGTPWGALISDSAQVSVFDPQANPVEAVLNTRLSEWSPDGCSPSWFLYDEEDLRSLLPRTFFYAAAVETGEAFTDDAGLTIEAVDLADLDDPANHPPGSLGIRVQSDPPPGFADLWVVRGWLDSPVNGFGSFLLGTGGLFNDPLFGGDPIATRLTPTADWSVFPPVFNLVQTTFGHRLEFRVRNEGTATARNVTGRLYILPLVLPIGLDLNSRVALEQVATTSFNVSLGDLGPGSGFVVRRNITPALPFQAVLLLDPVENEPNPTNNSRLATFLTVLPSFGSPYERVDVPVNVQNLNEVGHAVFPNVRGLPDGWTTDSVDPVSGERKTEAVVAPGEDAQFLVQIQPPDPAKETNYKPGTVESIRVQGWMNLRDEYVPFGEIPTVVVLTHPTRLSLEVKDTPPQAVLSGNLEYRPVGAGAYVGLADHHLELVISGSDGSVHPLPTTTGDGGVFSLVFDSAPDVAYAAVARFHGSDQHGIADSEPVTWGQAAKESLRDFILNGNRVQENLAPNTQVGEFVTEGASGPVDYEFVEGEGAEGNRAFAISGNALLTTTRLNYEDAPVQSIRVRATDTDTRLRLEKVFEIIVLDDHREDDDRDGLNEEDEEKLGSSDSTSDSDGDGVRDSVEAGLGTDPSSAADRPAARWKSSRGIRFEKPLAAHWDANGNIVVARTGAPTTNGVYEISPNNNVKPLAELDAVNALAVAPANDIFISESSLPAILKIPAKRSTPLEWVTTFAGSEPTPFGLAFSPVPAGAPPAKAGLGMVAAADARSGGIWQFNLDAPEQATPLHPRPAEFTPADLTVAGRVVYAISEAGPNSEPGLHRLRPDGAWQEVRVTPSLVNPRGLCFSPKTARLLVADQGAKAARIIAVDPATGKARVVVDGLSENVGIAGVDVNNAVENGADRLLVTDHAADSILEFELEYGRLPEIHRLDPELLAGSGEISIIGRHLERATAVWIGSDSVETFSPESRDRLTITPTAVSSSGFLRVRTPFGEAVSPRPLRLAGPPPELRLLGGQIGENLEAGSVVGRIEAAPPIVPNQGYALARVASAPDNAAFAIQGEWLVTAVPLDFEQQALYDVQVLATDAFGRPSSAAFKVHVLDRPEILAQPQSAEARAGSDVAFSVETRESDGLSFQWLRNGAPIPGATTHRLELRSVTDADEARYQAVVASPLESIASESAALVVTPGPLHVAFTGFRTTGDSLLLGFETSGPGTIILQANPTLHPKEWRVVDEIEVDGQKGVFEIEIDRNILSMFYRATAK